ncbi:hypothetical protein ACHAXN_005617 [Cyclotella atomus]
MLSSICHHPPPTPSEPSSGRLKLKLKLASGRSACGMLSPSSHQESPTPSKPSSGMLMLTDSSRRSP